MNNSGDPATEHACNIAVMLKAFVSGLIQQKINEFFLLVPTLLVPPPPPPPPPLLVYSS